jgi:diguanylate cyclase (GGDEF)-like protein
VDELNRLERRLPFPLSIVMVDLNGLKATNDRLGHSAGDAPLRRIGEVLNKAIDKPATAARIGGDEFAVLLPSTDERGAAVMVESIGNLIELNNQFYSNAPIEVSIGAATTRPGERLEEVAKRADAAMYEAKREFYAGRERRVSEEAA